MQRKITIIVVNVPSEKVNNGPFFTKLNRVIVDVGNTKELFLLSDFKSRVT